MFEAGGLPGSSPTKTGKQGLSKEHSAVTRHDFPHPLRLLYDSLSIVGPTVLAGTMLCSSHSKLACMRRLPHIAN
jgi:hypothetical protein